ncbi:MAG TPA: ABC transporter ATP-binding protein [Leptolyngbyaceae cyanobacterium M33_DOE_097]|uniref:ABC transporter ATP-binding protein n=1 Tax=Oscillatoriales cyanobacterium SpSt-418 TaxID=2282169 RepID=A0A7C3KG57_9CYAN|nr:ABC transporter ATP-binding protein [Leptolyngbyaceae cyanobacterium M33_DOE_097]
MQNLEKHVDRVLVLDNGVLIEQGSHEELPRQKGAYWMLCQQQQAAVYSSRLTLVLVYLNNLSTEEF